MLMPYNGPRRLDSHSLANLIKHNDYKVIAVDDIQTIVVVGTRTEKAASYTLHEAERIAFGEVRTQCHWIH